VSWPWARCSRHRSPLFDRRMYCVMSVEHFYASLAQAAFHTDTTLAIIRWLSGTSFTITLQVLLCACKTIRMPILILDAILAYVRVSLPIFIFGTPSVVEAVFEAINGHNRCHDAAGCCSLHDLPLVRVGNRDDIIDRGLRMPRSHRKAIKSFDFGPGFLELGGEIMSSSARVRTDVWSVKWHKGR
jgi:hypothetical protein